jgi:hypothetical protein
VRIGFFDGITLDDEPARREVPNPIGEIRATYPTLIGWSFFATVSPQSVTLKPQKWLLGNGKSLTY